LPKIEESIEVQASKDRVWEIISDLENDGDYWYGTKETRIISRNGNECEREITQNFRNHKILQKVSLRPKEAVEIKYLKGLTEGVKRLSIETLSEDRQRLSAFWDIHFTGMYWFATPIISRHTRKGTSNTLQRIKLAAETNPGVTHTTDFRPKESGELVPENNPIT
jgi:hypothetical protein